MAKLLVVATPIGNLNDLTPRMREALSGCDLIAAEDTRVTMKLLNKLGISKPLISCHRHNEDLRADGLIEKMLAEDLTVALTCDAGTPGISDPGSILVRAATEAGIPVSPICGPSAVATAISAAGFDAREFAFYGFLPREKKPLREKLQSILETGIPVAVVYESPHRVVDLVEEIVGTLAGCRLSVACDLSKLYERILTGPGEEVLQKLKSLSKVEKGEYAIVLDLQDVPRPEKKADAPLPAEAALLMNMLSGASLSEAAEALDGYARNEIYRARLRVKRFLEEA